MGGKEYINKDFPTRSSNIEKTRKKAHSSIRKLEAPLIRGGPKTGGGGGGGGGVK